MFCIYNGLRYTSSPKPHTARLARPDLTRFIVLLTSWRPGSAWGPQPAHVEAMWSCCCAMCRAVAVAQKKGEMWFIVWIDTKWWIAAIYRWLPVAYLGFQRALRWLLFTSALLNVAVLDSTRLLVAINWMNARVLVAQYKNGSFTVSHFSCIDKLQTTGQNQNILFLVSLLIKTCNWHTLTICDEVKNAL